MAGTLLAAVVAFAPGPALVPGSAHAATGPPTPTRPADLPQWSWPVPPALPLVRDFEAPAHAYGPGHRGIDIGAGAGAEVRAVADGEVSFAGPVADRGVLAITHASGWKSSYEPVDALVAAGEQVTAGQVVARISAAPPHCGQPCLHLGARLDDAYFSPLLLLGGDGAVLLPWDD
jgi:murein DD-endopeptidase MepM/ murein hydrolase activator NlpD